MKSDITKLEQYVIDIVKQKRLEKKFTQKMLADYLLVSVSFIGDIESKSSRAKYKLSSINELAQILECSPKDFFPVLPFENDGHELNRNAY